MTTKNDGPLNTLTGVMERVCKSLQGEGLVRKADGELTLAELGEAAVQRMMDDAIREDPFLSRPQARATVYKSALGRTWGSFDRAPFANRPYREALRKIEATNDNGWAEEMIGRFDSIQKGWTK